MNAKFLSKYLILKPKFFFALDPEKCQHTVKNICILEISIKAVLFLFTLLLLSNYTYSQNRDTSIILKVDSLTLSKLIKQVVENHPSIKEAEEALYIADAKIGLAKAGYLPNVDATGNFTRIGPVPAISLPVFGTFKMAPANNYNAALEYEQTIYDFGKTAKDVNLANENKNLNHLSIEQLKQSMSMTATNSYYSLLFIQDAIEIKDEDLRTLNGHLEYIQKMNATGSATQYEILATQVRISNVESEKIDLETSREVQLSIINSLLGQPEKTVFFVKKELDTKLPEIVPDSLVSYAFAHRDEMKVAHEKSALAELQYNLKQASTNPTINFYASGGWKNGYFPDLDQGKLNYVAGVSLNVPLFDANRKKNNLLIAKSDIQNCNYEVDITGRKITTEVVQAEANVNSAGKKMKQFSLQLEKANKALSLAEIKFKAGVITNLDLLDATYAVSESKLLLLKSQIDYISNIFNLKNAIGDRLY